MLEEEAKQPFGFTEKAIEQARKLSRPPSKNEQSQVAVIFLGHKEHKIQASGNVYDHCSSLLEKQYQDFGTVEGHLEAISAHGRYEVRIYEPVKSRSVTCHIGDDELLDEAVGFFRCRVEVEGEVQYSQDGWPVSIKAKKITKLPESEELPSYTEMKGILREVTNGKG